MRSRQELYPVSFKCAKYVSYIEAIQSVSTLLVRGFTDDKIVKNRRKVTKNCSLRHLPILCRSENFIAL